MSKANDGDAEHRDEVTGKTAAEMEAIAEDLYEHRDEIEGDQVPVEYTSEVRSVVSVRFARNELDDIAAAAAERAGQPLSTYIRSAAICAAHSQPNTQGRPISGRPCAW